MADDDPLAPEYQEPRGGGWPLVKLLSGILAGVLLGGVGLPLLEATRGLWDGASLLVIGVLGWGFVLLVTLCVR